MPSENLYFIRNTVVQVEYRKRYPHMGNFKENKCGKIFLETLVGELEITSNFTVITYCSESCSCAFPLRCIFYRVYLIPQDDDIYTEFEWFEAVKLMVGQFNGNERSSIYTVEIKLNTMKRIGNIDMEISSLYIGPRQLLQGNWSQIKKALQFSNGSRNFNVLRKPVRVGQGRKHALYEIRAIATLLKTVSIAITQTITFRKLWSYPTCFCSRYPRK